MTPSDTGNLQKTQNHLKRLGSSSMTEGNINFILDAMSKMSEDLPDSQKPTDHHTKPLGQQKLQSPQRPRPSGHHSQAPWVANAGPSRRASKETQILRVLIAYKNTSSCLGFYKLTFVYICKFLPLSSIGHPAGHKKSHKNEHFEKVAFLVQFPYITASFC